MLKGYHDRVLRVNLTTGETTTEQRGETFWRQYLGGRNFVAYTLLTELATGIDPLGPDNKLICAPGPVTGFAIGGNGRHSVGAKAPLSGGYGDAEAGGFWGAEFRWTGFDALIVEGCAPEPVYLWIQDGKCEMRPAGHLWGKPTAVVQQAIRDELADEKIKVLQCGPAGENLVRFACVINDINRAAGRCGLGAVMGSKKLKAIAVRGRQRPPIADLSGLRAITRWLAENYKEKAHVLVEMGTPAHVANLNALGALPTCNFQHGQFKGAGDISGETMADTVRVGRDTCYACPIRCKQVVEIKEGPYRVDRAYGGPEYETLAALGANCGVGDLRAVAKANELCAANGLDTISTGATIAFAMECYERGILTDKDTGGLKLNFGNGAAMVQMVDQIVRREGLGDVLAEGTARAAQIIGRGAEEYALHVKGQEIPMHEPRFKHGLGVGYTLSPTGADHNHNIHDEVFTLESWIRPLEQLGLRLPTLPLHDLGPQKVTVLQYFVNWRHLLNCAVICTFLPYDYRQVRDILNAITGWEADTLEYWRVGERAANLTRLFNLREGLDADSERLPRRFFQAFTQGPIAEVALTEAAIDEARRTYYELMGWDRETGHPTPEKLKELSLSWVLEAVQEAER